MLQSLRSFLFPELCLRCQRLLGPQEHFLCLPCHLEFPYYPHWDRFDNEVFKTFWGQVPLS